MTTGFDVYSELGDWLRPYQRRFLADTSRFRIVLKPRQCGFSDGIALEMVLTASGLLSSVGVLTHNCTIISKRAEDASDVLNKCKKWVEVLRLDHELVPALKGEKWNETRIRFPNGCEIISETQSKGAGRSKTGHLYLDEYSWYKWQAEIWQGATPSIFSHPGLRLTVISTPNGTAEHYYEIWNDETKYSQFSRHYLDIYLAKEQGFPIDIALARSTCRTDHDFAQEFESKFVASRTQYISRELFEGAYSPVPGSIASSRLVGIDVASERDLTAVQALDKWPHARWLRHTFIIDGISYQSNDEADDPLARLGQDRIVDALLRYLHPDMTIVDASGDGAQLYGDIIGLDRDRVVVPHSFHRRGEEWKDQWVPEVRGGLASGTLKVEKREALVYNARDALAAVHDNRILDPAHFVEQAFRASAYPYLLMDFQKVRRVQRKNRMTYDTQRDASGHGDSFWASCMALSIAEGDPRAANDTPREQDVYSGYEEAEYADFM